MMLKVFTSKVVSGGMEAIMNGVVQFSGEVKNSSPPSAGTSTLESEPETGSKIWASFFLSQTPVVRSQSDGKKTYEIKCSEGKMASITVDSPCVPHEAVREFLLKFHPEVRFRGALILESEGKWVANMKGLQLRIYESTWLPPSKK